MTGLLTNTHRGIGNREQLHVCGYCYSHHTNTGVDNPFLSQNRKNASQTMETQRSFNGPHSYAKPQFRVITRLSYTQLMRMYGNEDLNVLLE